MTDDARIPEGRQGRDARPAQGQLATPDPAAPPHARPADNRAPAQPRHDRRLGEPPVEEDVFRPILSEHALTRFGAGAVHLRPRANVSVVVAARGKPKVYPPDQRPTKGELMWAGSGTIYEVDMGRHTTTIELTLPTRGDASTFAAEIVIEWRVKEATTVVRDGVRDVRAALRAPLLQRLRAITRQYTDRQVEMAEEAVTKDLADPREGDVGQRYGLLTTVYPHLRMNEVQVGRRADLAGVKHARRMEKKRQLLRLEQELNSDAIVAARVKQISGYIAQGQAVEFAAQIARDPTNMDAIMKVFRDQRNEDLKRKTEFIKTMIETGAVENWQIADQVSSIVVWLEDATNQVIGPTMSEAIPSHGSIAQTAVPRAELPNVSAQSPPSTDGSTSNP
jgi:hypothetical protein